MNKNRCILGEATRPNVQYVFIICGDCELSAVIEEESPISGSGLPIMLIL